MALRGALSSSPVPASPPASTLSDAPAPGPRRVRRGPPGAPRGASRLGAALGVLVLAGAALLVAAEPQTLFTIHVASRRAAVVSVLVSAHDSYALVPIAALTAVLAFGVWRRGSRVALAAVAGLGLAALLIALLGDLPDAHAHGVLRLAGGRLSLARARPALGFYLETLGALMLLAGGACGLLISAP